MFDPPKSGETPSLLMRARATADRDRTGVDEPTAEDYRAARSRRRVSRPNPLLAGLRQSAEAEADIEEADRAETERARRRAAARQVQQKTAPAGREPPFSSDNGALVDPVALIGTIWRWRYGIAGLTILGGIVGVLIALSSQPRYTAASQILLDPRELQLVGRDLEREFLANEAALAIVDSRLALVKSRPVLERVIAETNLDQDPEFNGTADGGIGLGDGLAVIRSLFSNETPVDTSDRMTLENLRDAINIERETRTFIVEIAIEARSPRKAAMLANAVTEAFITEQSAITSDKARSANTALTGRLDDLQSEAEAAERRVEAFRIENGLVSTQGRLLSEDEVALASAQLTEARAATIRAQSRADAASATTVDAAISGAIPADLNTGALTTFRAQLSSLRQSAAQLENQLGPRHPRLASAQAAVNAARQDIASELRRIAQGAQAELRRAVQTEQELAAQVARAKAVLSTENEALVALRDLQTDAEAARSIYNAALLRARETGEVVQIGTVNASILSEAEPPIDRSSMSRRTIAMAGAFGGFLFGLGLALIAGLINAVQLGPITGGRSKTSQTTDQEPAVDEGSKTQRTQDKDAMYPGYPHAHQAPQQPQPAGGYPQQMASPTAPWPQQQPVMAAAAAPVQPAPVYAPAPQAPAAYGYPQTDPYVQHQAAYQPMPAPAQPMAWSQQPAPAPAPMPAAPQAAPWPPAPAQPVTPVTPVQLVATAPYPQPTAPAQDDREMDELRQSVRDIREVVEELAARRSMRAVG